MKRIRELLPFIDFSNNRKTNCHKRETQTQATYESLELRQLLATITWSSGDITGDSDVSTNGDSVFAISGAQGDSGSSISVNGVNFLHSARAAVEAQAQSQSPGNESLTTTIANDNNVSFLTGGLGDVGQIIRGGWFGTDTDNTATVTLTGLSVGEVYELQIFSNDARSGRDQGFITRLGDGNGGFGVDLELSNQPNGGAAGDFGIGTFVADTTEQVVELAGFLDGAENQGRLQVNAIQLRKIEQIDLLPGAHPLINEFSASNASVLDDDNGNSTDWIEIFNAGEDTVDLTGYTLTDDPAVPNKYVFPDTSLVGGDYLIVFAGDDDDPATGTDLYTGFGLSRSGEYLGFFDDAGNLVSEFGTGGSDYPAQFPDVSYGLVSDGNYDQVSFFATPTPNARNVNPVDGVLDELPDVSVERGFYEQAFDTQITSQIPGATIAYTTDGTAPSLTNGTQVTPATSNSLVQFTLNISETTPLRTAHVRDGFFTPSATTHTYVFLDDVITSPVLDPAITGDYSDDFLKGALLDLPTLSFTYNTEITDSFVPEQSASIEWLAPDGSEGFQVDAGISAFGGFHSSSQRFTKKNFRVEFRSQYGPSQLEFPLFEGFDNGIAASTSFDSLDFRTGSHDRFQLASGYAPRFVDDTLLEAGHVAPHGRFVHIYTNGVYWGQYHMRERWDADFLSQYYGGDEDDYEAVNGNHTVSDSVELNGGIPTPDGWSPGEIYDGDGVVWEQIKLLADTAGDATSEGPTGGYQELKEIVNLEQYIDFSLIYMAGGAENEFRGGGSIDGSVGYSFYFNDPDRWLRIPSDRTDNASAGNILGTLVAEADPEFMVLYADRIQHLFGEGGVLSPERSAERLQSRLDETARSYVLESARYERFDEAKTPEDFTADLNTVLDDIVPEIAVTMINRLRARGIFPQIDAPDFFIDGTFQNGGQIESGDSLSLDAVDTIYYTTNGADPRLEGGGINPAAIAYQPVSVTTTIFGDGDDWKFLDDGSNQGTAWRATSFDDSSWVSGASELGYGDDPATTVSYGDDEDDKHITTYFRKTFDVVDSFDTATLDIFYDDGAVIYLNGSEVGRANITGSVDWQTRADSGVNDGVTAVFDISDFLVVGSNTLAVEIHQVSPTSSDISFNAELEVTQLNDDPDTIPLFTSTNVQARTYSGGDWSALRDATFVIPAAQSEIRISEIHFNPADPDASELAAGFDDNDEFEFIEIFNPNPIGSINLSGIQLSDGVTFIFSDVELLPGERAVVVENADAFFHRYGTDIRVLGEWNGGLSNSGEVVELLDGSLNEIVSVNYGDNDPWHRPADGAGFSLVLDQPHRTSVAELGKYYSWRTSTEFGGTPGAESVQPLGVVINEVLANTDGAQSDSIELFNPGATAIDIGGWYLSDESDALLKYQIPAGTVLSAGGYIVFNEDDFNPNPANPGPNDFALSGTLGDQVYLSQASGGTLVGLEDAVEFDATFSGDSLGRLPDGTGRLTRLAENSLGGVNGAHAVSTLVISEVNYHPASPTAAALAIDADLTENDLEFIEIANPTNAAIDLTNWRIRGESDYDFVAGTSIPAGGTIVVLAFDPDDAVNATRLAAFMEHYGVTSSSNFVGGLEGSLSNSSGRIALQQPDAPDGTVVPRVVVDEVVYDDLAPWADADGSGSSLNRTGASDYANDAGSWDGQVPTPGVSNLVQSMVTSVEIAGGSNQRSSINNLVVSFVGEVDIASDAFSLIQRSDANGTKTCSVVESSFTTEVVDGNTVVTISFSSLTRNSQGDLADGNYELTVDGQKVTRSGTNVPMAENFVFGADESDNFFSLYGDFDGNRNVNVVDLLSFRQTYLLSAGDANYNADVDYDGSGTINVLDLLRFRQNFQKTLAFV